MRRVRLRRIADAAFVAMLAMVCGGLLVLPTGFERPPDPATRRARARVRSADDDGLFRHQIVRTGTQRLELELLDGPHRGRHTEAVNHLLGKLELDEFYAPGDSVLVEYTLRDGQITAAVVRGHYRLRAELILAAIFCVLLVGVAGWTGVKSILSFAFAALMIWKVMAPAFLRGWDPVTTALAVVAALTGAISFLVGGLTRKGLTAFLGAALGLGLTAVLAGVFTTAFRIHGAVRPFAETLLYSGFAGLDLTRIFIAGVFLAASGAVMDLAMDVAAAMDEIKAKRPDIGLLTHMGSGLRVGRPVIGTMTTTLLLAYSGGYTTMLMLFISQGVPPENVLNLNYVAAAVLNTLVGSFGLVTVAPFTAMVGAVIYRSRVSTASAVCGRA